MPFHFLGQVIHDRSAQCKSVHYPSLRSPTPLLAFQTLNSADCYFLGECLAKVQCFVVFVFPREPPPRIYTYHISVFMANQSDWRAGYPDWLDIQPSAWSGHEGST
ncbi:hypothetical protein AVEN_85440-1 [Araneus ventricosus]|uniref:Uncharacterized protein n=1 Tax=Araneus ventricosus TaxID=182803 RepID=A0A4Y2L7Z6_ARAVE|nr:hypothetical protein AVEN_85440-1 [Araneus ventricosus]